MANTYVDYTGDGSNTDFAFSFPFLEDSHVVVEVDGVDKTIAGGDFTLPTTSLVRMTTAPSNLSAVRVKRVSGYATDLVDFVNGSVLNEADLDKAYLHNRYLNEEAAEGNNDSMQTVGGGTDFNAESKKIVNLATPTVGTDAANKNYIDDRVALASSNLNGFDKSTHTGDNTETEFTLSFTPQTNTAEAYLVTIDGVLQTPTTAYSVSTSTNKITFTSAPPTSANIVVIPIGTTSSANDATVTQAGTSTTKTLANWTNDLQAQAQSVTATGSTAARTLPDRFADVVNVLDYGADDTGAVDAATNIGNAITAATSSGKSVYIPAGDYKLSSTLTVPSNCRLYGDGYTTRLFRDTSVTPFDMLNLEGVAHVTLTDFLLDGVSKLDNATASNRYCGIRVWANAGSDPNNIEIHGVHINSTTNGEGQSEGNRGAIMLEKSYDVRISRCKFYDNRGTCIHINGAYADSATVAIASKQIQIEQCWGKGEVAPFLAAYPDGFGSMIAASHCEDILISGCYADDFGFSNITVNGPRCTIQNCISKNSAYANFNIGHTTFGSNADDTVVDGNISKAAGYEGYIIAGSKGVVLSNNISIGDGTETNRNAIAVLYDGNYDAGETKNITIIGNNVKNAVSTAVVIEAGGLNINFKNNSVVDSGSGGLFIRSRESSETLQAFVSNNSFINNGNVDKSAVEINADSTHGSTKAVVINNFIYSSDITTQQGFGITANDVNATVEVDGNWFSSGYQSGKNTSFANKQYALNEFSSASLSNANIINV
jgi:hypothetical protein